MSHIKSKDTSIEILLRKALWHEGIRYRKNYKKLPGNPDIAITKYKIAIFCDGEFWHGKAWNEKKGNIKTNRDYWVNKIERNINRDNKADKELEKMGWIIFRYWGNEIKKNLVDCVGEIKETIYEVKNKIYYKDEYNETGILYAAEDEPEYR
jgi:DNA mismatch endonuclease (patch repair protein)